MTGVTRRVGESWRSCNAWRRVWMTCECGAELCHWLAPPLDGTRRHAPGSAMLHSAEPVRRARAWTRPVCSKPVSDHSRVTRRTLARGPSDGAAHLHGDAHW